MGFALWIEGDICRACGTHEYRPMGVAVISASDHFRARDFRPQSARAPRNLSSFVGYFASIGEMNHFLDGRKNAARAKPAGKKRAMPPRFAQLL
jgi:hypothetical protein